MDSTSRKFLRAARQRLMAACFLRANGYNLDAFYLGGYAIECSLKALIIQRAPRSRRSDVVRKITQGARWHDPEILGGELAQVSCPLPRSLLKSCIEAEWSPQLRYEPGRRDTASTEEFLKLALRVIEWTEGRLV